MILKESQKFGAHLLVIDDDDRIRELLSKYLFEQNYLVSVAKDALDAESLISNIKFDLIITDKMMPVKDGIEFVNDIRSKNESTPIIMLTAADDIDSKIEGLSLGIDDYIAKPFSPQELLLRIRNILKRIKKITENKVKFGEFEFSIDTKKLTFKNEFIKLTTTQEIILETFIKNKNTTISRENLANLIGIDGRSVDVAIARLRKTLQSVDKNNYIFTIRNTGYKFVL